jgi:hypothetical protein
MCRGYIRLYCQCGSALREQILDSLLSSFNSDRYNSCAKSPCSINYRICPRDSDIHAEHDATNYDPYGANEQKELVFFKILARVPTSGALWCE